MIKYFHASKKKIPYFEGWYLKHQADGRMIAFISAVHADAGGKWTASIQVITEQGSWCFPYTMSQCRIDRKNFRVKIGNNVFAEQGMWINLKNKEISISGQILYGPFTMLEQNIMGPFRFLPFLQCNHGVISMMHKTYGNLVVNGTGLELNNGTGYIETDWGSSFPKEYLWTQCILGDINKGSIMLSIADVPIGRKSFCGCICAICHHGRTYRLATYLGASIVRYNEEEAVIEQRKLRLKITKLGERSFNLNAPQKGSMSRTIRESPVCRVRYQFWKDKKVIFDRTENHASYEYVNEMIIQ